MKKIIFLTLICCFSISNPVMAGSDTEKITLPAGKWWQLPRIVKELGLTTDEQKKLDDLFVENRRNLIDLKRNLEKEKFELEQLFEKQIFNESACKERFKRLQDAQQKLANERFRFLIEARKLLGTDRYQKITAQSQERRIKQMRGRGDFKDALKRRILDK